jgi:hypothetical protein
LDQCIIFLIDHHYRSLIHIIWLKFPLIIQNVFIFNHFTI